MLEEYIFKTVISFISLNAVCFMTKENYFKLNVKRHSFIERMVNRLLPCLIPVFRWIYIAIILIVGIVLGDDNYVKQIKERMGDK